MKNLNSVKNLFCIIILNFTFIINAQSTMKPIENLINKDDPAWPIVKDWIIKAKNEVEVLAVNTTNAQNALYHTQVTTRSPMGAIIYETGGVVY